MDNRYPFTGTVIEITEPKQITPFLRKQKLKIRFTDLDFANKIAERKVVFEVINDYIDRFESVRVDDQIDLMYYIEGRDYPKKDNPEIIMNFTSLIAYECTIISSPTRDTKEDKNAVITNEGKVYKDPILEATDDALAGITTQDPLLAEWDKKKNSYALVDDGKGGTVAIIPTDENPFNNLEEVKGDYDALPF